MSEDSYLSLNGHLLKVFLAVYDTSSVSKAAENLDLNQSTVSYSLEKLRECLGDPLFVKNGRGIVPTDQAIMLAPLIRRQLAGLEGLVSNRTYLPDKDTARFTIAANVNQLLPEFGRLYRSLRKIAPNLKLRLLDLGPRENLNKLLNSGAADLVITVSMKRYSAVFNYHPIFAKNLVCYYDPDCRGSIETAEEYFAANHACLSFGGKMNSAVDEFLKDQPVFRKKTLQAPSIQVLAELVRGTDFVITMPYSFRHSVFSDLCYCKPPVPMDSVPFDMVWHRRAEHSGRNEWMRNLVIEFMN